jgi:5-methylcytosine-specific restriction protein A
MSFYHLEYDGRLDECRERLVVGWRGGRPWHQHAARNPKPVLAAPPSVLALLPGVDQDDDEEDAGSPEGRILIRAHKARERDPGLRQRKIAVAARSGQPLICEACDFDFGDFYGERGAGFIECHHIAPLSRTGQTVTRLKDLALICSNCHRMAHRQPWLMVAELRDLIGSRQARE